MNHDLQKMSVHLCGVNHRCLQVINIIASTLVTAWLAKNGRICMNHDLQKMSVHLYGVNHRCLQVINIIVSTLVTTWLAKNGIVFMNHDLQKWEGRSHEWC